MVVVEVEVRGEEEDVGGWWWQGDDDEGGGCCRGVKITFGGGVFVGRVNVDVQVEV